jgi:dTDP-4-dehydrorhamnose 3,5-epimerase
MKVLDTRLEGVKRIELPVFRDERGYFMETFQEERYAGLLGLHDAFVQDNVSQSRQGVLRGLHYQATHPQGKLISVVHGRIFDVAVDLRADSPTFGQWQGHELSAASDVLQTQLWIPPGFAHGFLVLSDAATVHYKCTDYYRPDDEVCVLWNDADIDIAWPEPQPIVSTKDAQGATLASLQRSGRLPRVPGLPPRPPVP